METRYTHPDYDEISDSIGESVEAATHALERRTRELSDRTASGWFIYDGVDGGLDFARAIYERFEALAERARDQLRDCHCGQPNGCPACTFNEHCGNYTVNRSSAPLRLRIDVLNELLGEEYGGERRPYSTRREQQLVVVSLTGYRCQFDRQDDQLRWAI